MQEINLYTNDNRKKRNFLILVIAFTVVFCSISALFYFFFSKDSSALDLIIFLFKQQYQSGSLSKAEFISFLFHLTLDWFSFSSAIYISLGCFFFHQTRSNFSIQFIGIIFLAWASFNFMEFIILRSPRENLTEFYWQISRSILAALFLLTFFIIAFYEKFKLKKVKLAVTIICLYAFASVIYGSYYTIFNKKIPRLLFDGLLRYQLEIIPAAAFFLVMICSYVFYRRSTSFFSLGLFLCFLPIIVGETYIAFSPSNQINSYNLASFLELFALMPPLLGISIDNLSTFWVIENEKKKTFQANKTKNEFIGLLSNELNIPLNSSKGFLKSLKNETDGPLTEEQKYSLNKLSEGCTKVLELINELSDLTNVQSGKIMLHKEHVNVSNLIQSTLKPINIMAREKNLAIDIKIDPATTAQLDVLRFKQLLVNIFNYVMEISCDGEIHLTTETDTLLEIYVRATVLDKSNLYLLEKSLEDTNFSVRENIQIHLPLFISKIVLEKMGGILKFKIFNKDEFKFNIIT